MLASLVCFLAALLIPLSACGGRSDGSGDLSGSATTRPSSQMTTTTDVPETTALTDDGMTERRAPTTSRAPASEPAAANDEDPASSSLPDCGSPIPSQHPEPGITVELAIDNTQPSKHERVEMNLTVTNHDQQPVDYWTSGPPAQFWVIHADTEIWISIHGMTYPAVVKEERLEPGEVRRATAHWDQRVCDRENWSGGFQDAALPPGRYTARALWHVEGRGWWSNPVDVTISE